MSMRVNDNVHFEVAAHHVSPGTVVRDNLGRLLMKLGNQTMHPKYDDGKARCHFVFLDPSDPKLFHIEPNEMLTYYGEAHINIVRD
jgi:hypothetical protein